MQRDRYKKDIGKLATSLTESCGKSHDKKRKKKPIREGRINDALAREIKLEISDAVYHEVEVIDIKWDKHALDRQRDLIRQVMMSEAANPLDAKTIAKLRQFENTDEDFEADEELGGPEDIKAGLTDLIAWALEDLMGADAMKGLTVIISPGAFDYYIEDDEEDVQGGVTGTSNYNAEFTVSNGDQYVMDGMLQGDGLAWSDAGSDKWTYHIQDFTLMISDVGEEL